MGTMAFFRAQSFTSGGRSLAFGCARPARVSLCLVEPLDVGRKGLTCLAAVNCGSHRTIGLSLEGQNRVAILFTGSRN